MAKVVPSTAKTEETKAITPAPAGNPQLPSFMQRSDGPRGLDIVKKYVTPPRLKVVQRQSLPPLCDMFAPGDVIAMPAMKLVSPVVKGEGGRPTTAGTPFHFIPLFYYPEWVLWNPMEMKGQLPAIRERTGDPRSNIALRSKTKETWSMPCPEMPQKDGKPLFCRYVEHLNVIAMLLPPSDLWGMPVIMSFARSEHKVGTGFAGLLSMRNADIYGCQFEAVVGPRQNERGAWLGLNISNPSAESGVEPFVQDEAVYRAMEVKHNELAAAYAEGLLRADYEDPDAPEEAPKTEF